MRPVQTVAARTVGEVLVEVAEAAPAGRCPIWPGRSRRASSDWPARSCSGGARRSRYIQTPTASRASRRGALLTGADARIQGPAYEEWLAGEDASALPI